MRQLSEKLLEYFRAHEGEAISRETLARDVWRLVLDPRSRCIDQTIAELRRHLLSNERIVTMHGTGYRYERVKN
jgi:DNA-binding response OmpR family regulator